MQLLCNKTAEISFHKKFLKRVTKTEIYKLHRRVVSLERDSEYQPLSVFKNDTSEVMNEAIYILDEAKQVHMLVHKSDESGEFECKH